MLSVLEWLGQRARWVLAIGVLAALVVPELANQFSGTLPFMVVLVFALAVARLDIGGIAARCLRPRRLAVMTAWVAALMVLTPTLMWAGGQATGLSEPLIASLVYTAAAPPITSAAALCLMIGLDAALALELTVLASLLTPLIGPVVTKMLLGEAVPIDAMQLALRTGAMIAAGGAIGISIRWLTGPRRIERHKTAFDGVAALSVVLFIMPLFEGVGPALLADPAFGLGVFLLSVVANIGVQLAAWAFLSRAGASLGLGHADAVGAAALAWGNRTVALYLAALPADPVFQLFVALYQIPMLLTPLVMRRILCRHSGERANTTYTRTRNDP